MAAIIMIHLMVVRHKRKIFIFSRELVGERDFIKFTELLLYTKHCTK